MPVLFDRDLCSSCGMCEEICPGDVIAMTDEEPQVIYPEECFHCGACLLDCADEAISFRIPLPMRLSVYKSDFFSKESIQ